MAGKIPKQFAECLSIDWVNSGNSPHRIQEKERMRAESKHPRIDIDAMIAWIATLKMRIRIRCWNNHVCTVIALGLGYKGEEKKNRN